MFSCTQTMVHLASGNVSQHSLVSSRVQVCLREVLIKHPLNFVHTKGSRQFLAVRSMHTFLPMLHITACTHVLFVVATHTDVTCSLHHDMLPHRKHMLTHTSCCTSCKEDKKACRRRALLNVGSALARPQRVSCNVERGPNKNRCASRGCHACL